MAEIDAFLKRRGEDEKAVSEKVERLQTSLQKLVQWLILTVIFHFESVSILKINILGIMDN